MRIEMSSGNGGTRSGSRSVGSETHHSLTFENEF